MERRCALVLALLPLMAPLVADAKESANDFCLKRGFGDAKTVPAAYGRRLGGYCDGSVFQQHSGTGEVSVIGISAAPIAGDPGRSPISIVALGHFKDARDLSWPLHLEGVAKSREVSYRLDAGLSSEQPLVIGPDSAMPKMAPPLRAEEVAWSAWSDSPDHGRTYLPVIPVGATSGPIEIIVRPTIPASYVRYSVASESSGMILIPVTKAASGTKRGQPVTFLIPPGDPRIVVVEVLAVANSGETQAASIRLVRPGLSTK